MRISEITGVQRIKKSPVGYAARSIGNTKKSDYVRYDAAWNQFVFELEELGFKRLGRGAYGVVFEKPGYPWVFKIFDSDPGYFAYFNFAKEHQNLSAVPRIKGKYIRINDSTYAVRMEKLYPLNENEYHNLLKTLRKLFRNIHDETYKDILAELEAEWPDIKEVIDLLPSLGIRYVDLHNENIMKRADGSLVITDPLVD